MAKDFREMLVESSRHEQFGRFFKELAIGIKVVLSFQASETHACEPAQTLDDVYAYTKWEVSLRQVDKPIDVPIIGAWDAFKEKEWAAPFDRPEFQRGHGRRVHPHRALPADSGRCHRVRLEQGPDGFRGRHPHCRSRGEPQARWLRRLRRQETRGEKIRTIGRLAWIRCKRPRFRRAFFMQKRRSGQPRRPGRAAGWPA